MKKIILALLVLCVSVNAMQQDIHIGDNSISAPQPVRMRRLDCLSPVSSIRSDASSSRSSTPVYLINPEKQENGIDRFKSALCLACCGCCVGLIEAAKILSKIKMKSE